MHVLISAKHSILFGELSYVLANNMNGKLFRIIFNMGIKSCVSYNREQSSFFSSFRGVRQGENLSPSIIS